MRTVIRSVPLVLLCAAVVPGALARAAAQQPTGRIDQAGFVRIGGIDQWIDIHGADRANPAILVVHGGPGESQMFQEAKYEPWQRSFTVVQWDQRGAGRTFARNGTSTPDVNLDRITRDGIEVAEHLRRTLARKKIIVFGHSWGSLVAVQMAQRRPDLFAAYVGSGQATTWKAHEESVKRPMDAADRDWIAGLRASTAASLGVNQADLDAMNDGMRFTGEHVFPDQKATNLPATATDIRVPFFVIQGRDDTFAPTAPAIEYFNAVRAPAKELIVIENAGHFAFMTHPREFLSALVDKVRPVALSNGA